MFGEQRDVFGDLIGQFAGRSEDQRARLSAGLVHKTLQERKAKGRRLATAGLGAAEDVAAFEGGWNRADLDGGWLGEAQVA